MAPCCQRLEALASLALLGVYLLDNIFSSLADDSFTAVVLFSSVLGCCSRVSITRAGCSSLWR
jgi:hypothetical protein